MNSPDLTKPTRQSVKGLVMIFIHSVRQAVRMFWAIIAFLVLQKNLLNNQFIVFSALALIFVLLIVHTILYYLNFYFYVSEGEFILKKGYLKKKVLSIPLDRIQSVNTKQNIIQQVLDVVSLEIDTAGTVGKELKIHALEKPLAGQLQNYIQKKKSQVILSETSEEMENERAPEKPVLKLFPIDLLKIGISQNHIKTGLIIIAFGMQIFQQVQDLFSEKAEQYSNEFMGYLSNSSWALITFMLIFFLLVSVIYSLLSTVIKYFDFTLFKKEDTYRIESGLLNKRNVVIPMNKVQELNWETGPVKQIFGIYKLVFKQAVSGQQNRKSQQLVDAPGCLNNHLELLKSDLFGEDRLSDTHKFYSNKYYFWRLWMFSAWVPFILATPFLFKFWLFWLGAVLWIFLAAGYSYLILTKQYFNINNNQIRVSGGAISQHWKQMELYKIQAVEFRQTIFQKRRKLASLKLMNAAGTITIPFIDDALAKKMYNYLLYHTELSNRKWM
jgi:putative membrane protein